MNPLRNQRRTRWFLRLALGGCLLAWLLFIADLRELGSVVGRLDPGFYCALLALQLLVILLGAIKWRLLLPKQSLWLLYQLSFLGQLYSTVIPGQIAGEAMKAYRLGKGYPDAERVAASVLIDKITGFVALILVGFLGVYANPPAIRWPMVSTLSLGFAIVLGALFSMRLQWLHALFTKLLTIGELRMVFLRPVTFRLRILLDEWREFSRRPGIIAGSIGLGIVMQCLGVAIIMLIGERYGILIRASDWLWVFVLVSLAVVLPFSVGGIGLREGAFVGLLGFLGVPTTPALALSLTVFSVQLGTATIGGIFEISGVRRRGS